MWTDGFKESAPADKAAASVEPGPESVEPEAELASPESELGFAGLEFLTPTPREMAGDVVNLLTCRTLGEADMLVARLETGGYPGLYTRPVSDAEHWVQPEHLWLRPHPGLTQRL